jgi:hypothetical protein
VAAEDLAMDLYVAAEDLAMDLYGLEAMARARRGKRSRSTSPYPWSVEKM